MLMRPIYHWNISYSFLELPYTKLASPRSSPVRPDLDQGYCPRSQSTPNYFSSVAKAPNALNPGSCRRNSAR